MRALQPHGDAVDTRERPAIRRDSCVDDATRQRAGECKNLHENSPKRLLIPSGTGFQDVVKNWLKLKAAGAGTTKVNRVEA
jgi:hypothetical protein